MAIGSAIKTRHFCRAFCFQSLHIRIWILHSIGEIGELMLDFEPKSHTIQFLQFYGIFNETLIAHRRWNKWMDESNWPCSSIYVPCFTSYSIAMEKIASRRLGHIWWMSKTNEDEDKAIEQTKWKKKSARNVTHVECWTMIQLINHGKSFYLHSLHRLLVMFIVKTHIHANVGLI